MFVDTCCGLCLPGSCSPLWEGRVGQNVGHLDTSWLRGVCSEQKALEPERDL